MLTIVDFELISQQVDVVSFVGRITENSRSVPIELLKFQINFVVLASAHKSLENIRAVQTSWFENKVTLLFKILVVLSEVISLAIGHYLH